MKSSSTESNISNTSSVDVATRAVRTLVHSVDVACLSGSDAVALLELVTPALRQLNYFSDCLAARAVEANQHNEAGASSGARFVSDLTGVSEQDARRSLARSSKLSSNPDIEASVREGGLSEEKAEIIAHAANGEFEITQRLLAIAPSCSVEELRRRAATESTPKSETPDMKRMRLRRTQFISLNEDNDGMIHLRGKLLGDVAAKWLTKWTAAERLAVRQNEASGQPIPTSAAAAEAFSEMLSKSGGSSKAVVNYHVKLEDWQKHWPTSGPYCEIPGLGPVPASVLADIPKDSPLRLVITSKNKLSWYSEARSLSAKELPEFIKRAVKAAAFGVCQVKGCVKAATEVDHKRARCKLGPHHLDNLQALCDEDHDAKTRIDAPWTAGGIFGATQEERSKLRKRRQAQRAQGRQRATESGGSETGAHGEVDEMFPDGDEMFPDTG